MEVTECMIDLKYIDQNFRFNVNYLIYFPTVSDEKSFSDNTIRRF